MSKLSCSTDSKSDIILHRCDDETPLDGVRKGAHTEEQALVKYDAWLEGKNKQISDATSAIEKTKAAAAAKALAAEKGRAAKEAAIAAKNTPEALCRKRLLLRKHLLRKRLLRKKPLEKACC